MSSGEKMLVRAVRVGVYGCGEEDCQHVDKFGVKATCLTRRYPAGYPQQPTAGKPFWIQAKDFSDCTKKRSSKTNRGSDIPLSPGWMEKLDPQPAFVAPAVAVAEPVIAPSKPDAKPKKSRSVI